MVRLFNRRRRFFVKKEFQGKFILLYALAIISLAGLIAFLFYRNGQYALAQQLYISHIKVERTGEILLEILLQTNIAAVFAIFLLVVAVSFVVFGRLNVHFFRMEKRLDAMSRGDFTLEPQPASHFNDISRLIDLVQGAQSDYRERLRAIAGALDQVEDGCRKGGDPDLLRAGQEKLDNILRQAVLPE